MLKEFRDFLMRGNIVDLAVAVVIGGAFGVLVGSLVANLLLPIVAAIVGEPSFRGLEFTINGSVFGYGNFLTDLITFVSIAAAVFFFVVKPMSAIQARRGTAEEEETAADIALLTEIRDELRAQRAGGGS